MTSAAHSLCNETVSQKQSLIIKPVRACIMHSVYLALWTLEALCVDVFHAPYNFHSFIHYFCEKPLIHPNSCVQWVQVSSVIIMGNCHVCFCGHGGAWVSTPNSRKPHLLYLHCSVPSRHCSSCTIFITLHSSEHKQIKGTCSCGPSSWIGIRSLGTVTRTCDFQFWWFNVPLKFNS